MIAETGAEVKAMFAPAGISVTKKVFDSGTALRV
jgi:hypothetical protein